MAMPTRKWQHQNDAATSHRSNSRRSDICMASLISTLWQRIVLFSLVCPSRNWTALRFPVAL